MLKFRIHIGFLKIFNIVGTRLFPLFNFTASPNRCINFSSSRRTAESGANTRVSPVMGSSNVAGQSVSRVLWSNMPPGTRCALLKDTTRAIASAIHSGYTATTSPWGGDYVHVNWAGANTERSWLYYTFSPVPLPMQSE